MGGWNARRFEVRGTIGMAVRRKGQGQNEQSFQDYFGKPLPQDASLPEFRAEFAASKAKWEFGKEILDPAEWPKETEYLGVGNDEDDIVFDASFDRNLGDEVDPDWAGFRENSDD